MYGDENGKGEYLLKLAEDLWTNRTETDKMKNIAIAVHQFGHLLGATEVQGVEMSIVFVNEMFQHQTKFILNIHSYLMDQSDRSRTISKSFL